MNVTKRAVAVAAGSLDTIMQTHVEGFREAGVSIKNNTANAFDQFEIRAKFSLTGEEVILAQNAGDLSTPLFPLRRADPLVTLGGNTTGKLFINVEGIHTLIIKASAAAGGTNVDIDAQIS